MIQEPKKQGMNIVFLGNFNPKIFQPAWFVAQNLLKKKEAESIDKGKLLILDSDLLQFQLDPWLFLRVAKDQFYISVTNEAFYEEARDLVLGTFNILKHTPINKMGINLEMHFQIESEEKWHSIGHFYTPKKPWEKILKKPGMRSLVIEDPRPDQYKGYVRVTIQPSIKVLPYGVYVHINDHYEVRDSDSVIGCSEIIDILKASWKSSLKRSNEIIYKVLEQI